MRVIISSLLFNLGPPELQSPKLIIKSKISPICCCGDIFEMGNTNASSQVISGAEYLLFLESPEGGDREDNSMSALAKRFSLRPTQNIVEAQPTIEPEATDRNEQRDSDVPVFVSNSAKRTFFGSGQKAW